MKLRPNRLPGTTQKTYPPIAPCSARHAFAFFNLLAFRPKSIASYIKWILKTNQSMSENFGTVRPADGIRDERLNQDIRRKDAPSQDPDTKIRRIKAACDGPHGVSLLIDLATSVDGLCNDQSRCLACKYEQINTSTFAPYDV